jgi:hypothetical protein
VISCWIHTGWRHLIKFDFKLHTVLYIQWNLFTWFIYLVQLKLILLFNYYKFKTIVLTWFAFSHLFQFIKNKIKMIKKIFIDRINNNHHHCWSLLIGYYPIWNLKFSTVSSDDRQTFWSWDHVIDIYIYITFLQEFTQ